MSAYVSGKDLRDITGDFVGVISTNDLEDLSEAELVNVQLVSAILSDPSKTTESINDYSYNNNLNAFSYILSRLNFLRVGEETISGRKKSIRVQVV